MEERFSVKNIHICPVDIAYDRFKPNLNFPTRFCVIDEKEEIAIDIKTKLKYDYVKTMSHLYFIGKSYEKIKRNKRVAMLPIFSFEYDEEIYNESNIIINMLKNGETFKDGNEVYDNEQYLEFIKEEYESEKQEQILKQNQKQKRKGFIKRKK